MQVLCASMNICGCVFIAIFSNETTGSTHFFMILMVTLIRLYLLCRLGEDLLDKVSKKIHPFCELILT